MYRLFVAIDLPEHVKEAVAGISGGLPGARWVPAEQLHLTLRFIGETEEGTFRQVKEALAAIAGAPFTLALQGVGYFPPGKHPRVLWVGMEAGAPLLELQQGVELAVTSTGIAPETRRFSPHITIARLKDTPAAKVDTYRAIHGGFQTEPFTVEVFHLYSSTLSSQGAVHRREAAYPLQAKG